MSSKKHRKRIKKFYQNGKMFFNCVTEAERMVSSMIALGRAIRIANIDIEKFNKKYHECTSHKNGN